MDNDNNQLQAQQTYFHNPAKRSFPIPQQVKSTSKGYFFQALLLAIFAALPIFSIICYFGGKRTLKNVKETISHCTHMHCELPTMLKAASILANIGTYAGLTFTFVWSISCAIFVMFFGVTLLLL